MSAIIGKLSRRSHRILLGLGLVFAAAAPARAQTNFGQYLMSFHACDYMRTICGDPRNHKVYLASSRDGASWTVLPGWVPFDGSVPDVVRRGNTIYVYTARGEVARYRLETGKLDAPVRVSAGAADGFVDPSLIVDEEGRLVLFFLFGTPGSDPAQCAPGQSTCVKRFGSATEVAGSDGTEFTLDPGDRADVTISSAGPLRSASDPDVFSDGRQFVLYISHGASIAVWTSAMLRGTYTKAGDLATNTGGIPSGYYDPATRRYWTYSHITEWGASVIRRAVHAGLDRTLLSSDWTTVLTGAGLGLTATTNVESPGFALNAAGRSLYFPRLVSIESGGTPSGSSEFTGLAVANLGTMSAAATLTVYDAAGSPIVGSDVSNPAALTLQPGEQIARIDWQIFGAGLPALKPTGWFRLDSPSSRLVGFFLMFDPTLSILDGADAESTVLTSFVLPEIEDGGFTQAQLANPGANAASVTLELVASNGAVRGSAQRTIAAGGVLTQLVADLFSMAATGSDYLRVTATEGVVPFEYFGRAGKYVQGLNGQDTSAGATTLYCPQYVVGGATWRTALSIVNLESTSGSVTLELRRDDGTVVATSPARRIDPRGKLWITDQKFLIDTAAETQGYVVIRSDGPRVAGSVVFGDQAQATFSSALPLVSELRSSAVFSQLASNETFFTGLAVLNPASSAASVTIEAFDSAGKSLGMRTDTLAAGQRRSQLVTQFFPALAGQSIGSGYLRVTSDRGVATFALFGTGSLSVLAAVPPQVLPSFW